MAPRYIIRRDTPVVIVVERYDTANIFSHARPPMRSMRWRWKVIAKNAAGFDGSEKWTDYTVDEDWAGTEKRAAKRARKAAERWTSFTSDRTVTAYEREA